MADSTFAADADLTARVQLFVGAVIADAVSAQDGGGVPEGDITLGDEALRGNTTGGRCCRRKRLDAPRLDPGSALRLVAGTGRRAEFAVQAQAGQRCG